MDIFQKSENYLIVSQPNTAPPVERSGFETWRNSKQSGKSKQISERWHIFRLAFLAGGGGGGDTPCRVKPRDVR